ncbi:MAG: transcriptional regulator NrdR [Acidobacteriota bacterium]
MRCPYCDYEDSRVIDSRGSSEGRVIRRRRECLRCGRRFTTKEYVEAQPLMVSKADGRREPFDRDKLRRSIQLACTKRPISTEVIDATVSEIENELRDKAKDEVESRVIGQMVMDRLRSLDEVAYVRFASVYRRFQAKEEFLSELEGLRD